MFKTICSEKKLNKIFISGGAHINTLFMKNNLVDNVIINYNPYVLSKGINLFDGEEFEKELTLEKVIQEKEMVAYRALYGDNKLWARPYDMFLDEINKNGQKYRFELQKIKNVQNK